MNYTPGPTQKAILRAVANGRVYRAVTRTHQNSCLKLHDHGLLDRVPGDSKKFRGTPAGVAWIRAFDANFGVKK